MAFKRDSLLFKVVFYNNIAIIVSTISIALFLLILDFNNREEQVKLHTIEKVSLLQRVIDGNMLQKKSIVYKIITDQNFKKEMDSYLESNNYKGATDFMQNSIIGSGGVNRNSFAVSLVSEEGVPYSESGFDLDTLSVIRNPKYRERFKAIRENFSEYYIVSLSNKNYVRFYYTYYYKNKKYLLFITSRLSTSFIEEIKEYVSSNSKNKLFMFSGKEYYAGDFGYLAKFTPINETFLGNVSSDTRMTEYYESIVDGISYFNGTIIFRDFDGSYVGGVGVAVSREDIIDGKQGVLITLLSFILIFVLFSTTIFSKFFYNLLKPLIKISKVAEDIGNGNYNVKFDSDLNSTGEITKLSHSFKKMISEIKKNHKKMHTQNLKLRENIVRIEGIERLLMGLHIEADMNEAIKTILDALTSDIGLGYSRAMYLRYSREGDSLIGEMSRVNPTIEKLKDEDLGGGFKFQIDEFHQLVKFIKLPFSDKNLIAKSLREKKVLYFNQKGFKYDLGNEIFKSMGIVNFIIIPIYSMNKNYGCIVLDYFGKNREITFEEYELINLLTMNISIRIKNKLVEEEKIDVERETTVIKLTERFLVNREEILNEFEEVTQKIRRGDKDLDEKLSRIEDLTLKIRKENEIFRDYSAFGESNKEPFELYQLIQEIIQENDEHSKSNDVNISVFLNFTGLVYGDRKAMKKAFYEVLKNAFYTVINSGKNDRKINILITKEKNIDKVRVSVLDNGEGLTEESLEKIYEPFTSVAGKTPGLGLSIVFRVIKEHNGVIKFFSKIGEGTEVKITLNTYKEEQKI